MGEAHPLQHEAPCCLHAPSVAAPVQQPSRAEVLEDFQALARADVPVALLLDLPKQASSYHLHCMAVPGCNSLAEETPMQAGMECMDI